MTSHDVIGFFLQPIAIALSSIIQLKVSSVMARMLTLFWFQTPHPPLHTPIHHASDPPHIDLLDRVRP